MAAVAEVERKGGGRGADVADLVPAKLPTLSDATCMTRCVNRSAHGDVCLCVCEDTAHITSGFGNMAQ